MNIETMLETYHVDRAHARYVADLALALYDAAREPFGLNNDTRRLLEISALLHNVGLTTDPAEHHLVGRDIVLRQPIDGLDADERAIVATAVAFHRRRVRPQQEPAFLCLGRKNRDLALQVAALLRVADGLDYSQSQTTCITACETNDHSLVLQLSGPYSAGDAARATAKADLWEQTLARPLTLVANGSATNEPVADKDEDEAEAEAAVELLPPWYGDGGAPLAELCRVLLRRQYRRMLTAERKARRGDTPEAVHELRVTTRRLRATLVVAAAVAPRRKIRAFRKAIQQVARAAAAMRDCDVFLENVQANQAELPVAEQAGLEPLITALRADRARALERMISAYEDEEYLAFKRDFAQFVVEADDEWDWKPRVRDLMGSTIYRQYEILRTHGDGPVLPDELLADAAALHQVRIEAKRLRYLLETCEPILGEQLNQAIEPLIALQDAIGALNDMAVARNYIDGLVVNEELHPPLTAYLANREASRPLLFEQLAKRWEKLASATYRRTLTGLIVKL